MCGGPARTGRCSLGASYAVLIMPLLGGCGKTAEELAAEPVSTGDQSVFSAIDVDASLSGYDSVSNARDDAGNFPALPAIRYDATIRVKINAGTSETRVPGLEIFARGKQLTEVGSAGLPQQFDYQGQLDQPLAESAVELTFRYQGSSFSTAVTPLFVTIVSPAQDSPITRDSLPVLSWLGLDQAPALQVLGACGFELEPGEVTNTSVSFRAVLLEPAMEPRDGCSFQLHSSWRLEDEHLAPPFASLKVRRSTSRLHRFTVE
jgi:hypothetical protein